MPMPSASVVIPSFAYKADLSPAKTEITHVKQTHKLLNTPTDFLYYLSPELLEKIAMAQYEVADAILNNSNALILQEGLSVDLDQNSAVITALRPYANGVFPEGLPDQYSKMNRKQKEFIVEHDAVITLLCLKRLSHAYRTISTQQQKSVLSQIDALSKVTPDTDDFMKDYALSREWKNPKMLALVYDRREEYAIEHAKAASAKTGNSNVFIIYGSSHDFEKRIQDMKDPSVVYKGSITTGSLYSAREVQIKNMRLQNKIKEDSRNKAS